MENTWKEEGMVDNTKEGSGEEYAEKIGKWWRIRVRRSE